MRTLLSSIRKFAPLAGYAAVSVILSVPLFLIAVDAMITSITIYAGPTAAALLFGILGAGIGELVVIIAVVEGYPLLRVKRRLIDRFLIVTAIELFLFPGLNAVRVLAYSPISRGTSLSPFFFLTTGEWILSAAGAAGGVLAIALRVLRRRAKKALPTGGGVSET